MIFVRAEFVNVQGGILPGPVVGIIKSLPADVA
jgi:hypothetical protein